MENKEHKWICNYCKLEFASSTKLREHAPCSNKPKYEWTCDFCHKVFPSRKKLYDHKHTSHAEEKLRYEPLCECNCSFCGKLYNRRSDRTKHEKFCKENPNRVIPQGRAHTDEEKRRLSEMMKKAHAEGRAGSFPSRKGCEKSYPEKWFESVIKNRFEDQNYEAEYHLGKYFLDFVWPQKKRFIEIDGQQHYRFDDRILHDKERDEFTASQGWEILRLKWSDVSSNKEEYIKIAKDFIDKGKILPKEEWPVKKLTYKQLSKGGERTEFYKKQYEYLVPKIKNFIDTNKKWGSHSSWARRLGEQLNVGTYTAAYLVKVYFPEFYCGISKAKK